MGEWTKWEKCSEECGLGRTRRVRPIKLSPLNGGYECPALFETKECEEKECLDPWSCDMTIWSKWSSCSSECGGGTSYRYFISSF